MRLRPRLLFLAVLLVVGACAPTPTSTPVPSASTAPDLQPVRLLLGFRPDVQFAPFYLAQQAGYFADAGLDVTIEHAEGGELIRLVADGQAEFGVADATDVMIARTSGIPVRYFSTLYRSFPVALIGPTGSVPADPADLAGRSIGTPGPFGEPISRLRLPGWMVGDAPIEVQPTNLALAPDGLTFELGEQRFRYDRLGLRPDEATAPAAPPSMAPICNSGAP